MKFIENSPAILIEKESILVIGDLHIGLAYHLQKKGINIPERLSKIEERIEKLIDKTKTETLVILGDVKHEVPGINYPELFELPKSLKKISEKVKVHICKGNHDTHLEKILPKKIKLHSVGGFKIGDYFFYHGHEWPSEEFLGCGHLFLSHVHPVFEFKDKFDYRLTKLVWLKIKVSKESFSGRYKSKKSGEIEIVLVPPFNKILGGYPINKDKQLNSPIFRNNLFDLGESEIYLLDGTFLGMLKDLH